MNDTSVPLLSARYGACSLPMLWRGPKRLVCWQTEGTNTLVRATEKGNEPAPDVVAASQHYWDKLAKHLGEPEVVKLTRLRWPFTAGRGSPPACR